MFWLNKPFSINQFREYLAFSGLEVTTDQNGRLVVYVISDGSISDASEMLKAVIKQHHLNVKAIPCDEQSRLYVRNKLTALPC